MVSILGLRILIVLPIIIAIACNGGGGGDEPSSAGVTPAPSPPPASKGPALETTLGLQTELFVFDARFPVALAFAPDGRLFYNELQTGKVRIVTPEGEVLEEPFVKIEDMALVPESEWGLIGLALDPEFESNRFVYVYYTQFVRDYPANEGHEFLPAEVAKPVVVRFTDVENHGVDPTLILGDLPETVPTSRPVHIGGNIHFGPDGYLYVTIGDMRQGDPAHDLGSLRGKILRVDKQDGSAPADNPFVDRPDADPRVFAYGFRNSFDFAFQPETGEIFATENAERTCDELNIVAAGQDYGWPNDDESVACLDRAGVPPIYLYADPGKAPGANSSTVGPTGIEFASGDVYPALGDSLLTCEWNTQFMRRFVLGSEQQVLSDDVVVTGCQLGITVSPDGVVYYSNITQIWRLVPQ